MALPELEDLTDALDQTCVQVLGDTVQFKPSGGTYAALKVHADYREETRSFDAAQLIAQDMTFSAPMTSFAARPSSADRITLPKVAGKTFYPANVRRDEGGTEWVFELVETSG